MADSGTYDDATLQRRYAMAQALMQHPAPIKHWAEGLGNIGESALGGYQLSKLDDERRAERAAGKAELFSALGIPAPDAAPMESQGGFQKIAALLSGGGAPAPAVAPQAASPAPMPAAAPPVAPQPAPVRMASLGPPPVADTPTRTPVEPIPDIIRTNPDGTIAGNITAPTIPAAGTKVAAALNPQANLTTAPPPPAPPAAPGGGILAGASPETKLQIAQLLTSRNPTAAALGSAILQQAIKPKDVSYQTTPDGTILKMDPTGKAAPTPVYQAATKPTFGVIGEEDGKKTYGFIDPVKGTATPLEPAKPGDQRPTVTGPDGKEIVIPKGVDVPTFRKEISKINADAAGGKMTEVQGNATQFANRMEAAESHIKKVEASALGTGGAAQQVAGKIPVVGSGFQSKEYQQYDQAKRQFVTAVLRKESGAAISASEFERYEKEFFPQPYDKPEVIAQKREARRVAVDAMKRVAGPSYKSPDLAAPADEGWQDLGGGVRIREKK